MHVSKNDHSGMNGLLAQNLFSIHGINAVVVSWDKQRNCYVGSGRGNQVKDALAEVAKNASFHFGGHAQAAGVHITKGELDDFTKAVVKLNSRRIKRLHQNDSHQRLCISADLPTFKRSAGEYGFIASGAKMDTEFYAELKDIQLLGSSKQKSGYTLSVIANKDDNSDFISLMHKGDLPSPLILEITPFVAESIFIDRVNKESLVPLEIDIDGPDTRHEEIQKICDITF